MMYQRCGRSGVLLPRISLGLWHNFGDVDSQQTAREMILRAFDLGITHFDLANNYGPPPGSAEINFGRILKKDLAADRDELIISTKAGYHMWAGPYGDWGSRKYLLASLDQSLKRMGLDYVDIFYHHRPDPDTPLEETMGALDHAVRSGQGALRRHLQLSAEGNAQARGGDPAQARHALPDPSAALQHARPLDRGRPDQVLEKEGIGCIVFSPLAQGQLTDRYLKEIPADSRARREEHFLKSDAVQKNLPTIRALNAIAEEARAAAGRDGAGVGVALAGGDLGADRRELHRATRYEREGAEQSRFLARGVERNPHLRARRRGEMPQPKGAAKKSRPVLLQGSRNCTRRGRPPVVAAAVRRPGASTIQRRL